MRARLIAAAAVLAAVGLMTSACTTTNSGSAAPQPTVTVTVRPTHSATTDASGSPHTSAAPVAAAANGATADTSGSPPASANPAVAAASGPVGPAAPSPAPCLTRYLGATLGASEDAVGSIYVVVIFKNLDNYSCTLYGYPGVAMDAGVPVTPVGLASVEDPATPRELVTLSPHGTAEALLRIMDAADYPAATCKPKSTQVLQVIPPNQYVPIYLGYSSQTCSGPVQILTVDAVRPGVGSS
jgi:hypothetical protein